MGAYTHDASDWHHIVLTNGTDNTVHAYRNGIHREDCTELANAWTINVFGTGYIDANGPLNASWTGTTDFAEIRYYNKELTQTEVTALYQNPFGVAPKGMSEGSMGGWTIAGDAIHSGTKVADSFPAAAGAITIGSKGYISANKFQITSTGNAKFSGSISLATDIGGDPMSDTWEVDSGQLKLLGDGYIGDETWSNTFTEMNTGIPSCFIAGTKILMSDDTYKNIEDIQLGDYVKSWNESTNEIMKSTEVVELQQPIHTDMIDVEFENGIKNKNTFDHPYYVKNKGWSSYKPEWTKERYEVFKDVEVNLLSVDDICYQIENDKLKELKVLNITKDWKEVQTYIFGLKEYNTFFANNILVHNKLPGLDFTEGHQYFIDIDTEVEVGDAVKLDEDNKLIKTTEARDSTCVGIAWEYFEEYVNRKVSKINYIQEWDEDGNKLTLEETRKKYINKELTEKAYVDSLGNNKQGDDSVKLYKVASLGDVRDFTKTADGEIVERVLEGFKVCNENGEVKKGDLVCTSNVPGHVMKQSVEYVVVGFEEDEYGEPNKPIYEERQTQCSYTIGKVMENVEFDEDGKAKDVYGYLYCG